jgi:hypothetical protein
MSYRTNIRHLQAAWLKLQHIGSTLYISFYIPKTVFIHWRTVYDRRPVFTVPIALNEILFKPLALAKWLGFWFSSSLSSHYHFQQRVSKARKTFGYLQSLSKHGYRLTAINARRLAQAAILPSLLYGTEVFQPKTASLNLLNTTWSQVLRWITNCFRSTLTNNLDTEDTWMPLEIYCFKN